MKRLVFMLLMVILGTSYSYAGVSSLTPKAKTEKVQKKKHRKKAKKHRKVQNELPSGIKTGLWVATIGLGISIIGFSIARFSLVGMVIVVGLGVIIAICGIFAINGGIKKYENGL